MEVHSEEILVKGLNIKLTVMLNITVNKYSVVCKAFDKDYGLIWKTELLDETGTLMIFNSLPEAIQKAKEIFLKKHASASVNIYPKGIHK